MQRTITRYGSVIGLRPETLEEYKRLHAAVWPDILQKITDCNIRNYSIFLRNLPDGNLYLFSYFEYIGTDFEADAARMAPTRKHRSGGRSANHARSPAG